MRDLHDEAFDEFAATAWPRLRRIGFLLTGDHHLAEDLAQTALVRTYASWRRVRHGDAPAYARRVLLNLNIDWGMGTDDFLRPGAPMEVFTTDSALDGADATLAIAGLDGTDVARAELIATDGTRTVGNVLPGTLVPGDTMIFGEVPGELARVVAYDAAGEVVEDHTLRDCDDPVDCEVR